MTLPRTLTSLLLTSLLLIVACGGTEGDIADEPIDGEQTIESTDDALRPRPPGGGTTSSCSAPTITCRNAKGQITGYSTGCSQTCTNQTAMCWAGSCGDRIIIDGSCGCFGI